MSETFTTMHHVLMDIADYFREHCRNAAPGSAEEKRFYVYVSAITDADRMLKGQEPRLLTLDETVNLIGVPRWAEYKVAIPGTNDVMVQAGWVMVIDEQLINREYDEHFVTFADEFGTHKYHVGAYKKGWRCWSARPTDEQREAVKWDD